VRPLWTQSIYTPKLAFYTRNYLERYQGLDFTFFLLHAIPYKSV
jgi:hypothetical protein